MQLDLLEKLGQLELLEIWVQRVRPVTPEVATPQKTQATLVVALKAVWLEMPEFLSPHAMRLTKAQC
tara:strand:+ start:230 stop:430 length:201 start_codon:yes stop_codon:yes gene_type:complete